MNQLTLEKALLSTQPFIALREYDSGECLVKFSRHFNEPRQGLVLVEIDYLWQIMGVQLSPQFLLASELLSPSCVTAHLASRLAEECIWTIRDPHYGKLGVSVSPNGSFNVFVGTQQIAIGLLTNDQSSFFFTPTFSFNQRALDWIGLELQKEFGATEMGNGYRPGFAAPGFTVFDLEQLQLDGIFASSQSAKNCDALTRVNADHAADFHTILINLPATTKLIAPHFLYELLAPIVGKHTRKSFLNQFIFVGFERHSKTLETTLNDLFYKDN